MQVGNNIIDFRSVPRYSDEPIRTFPKYVFENCNQVTCHAYGNEELTSLRRKAKTFTKVDLERWHGDNPHLTEAEVIARGEELDWIFGLDVLEKEVLPIGHNMVRALTIDAIIRYNGLFSRMDNFNPGEFRTHAIHWPKYDISDLNESTVMYALEMTLIQQFGQEKAGVKLRDISRPGKKTTLLFPRTAIEGIINKHLELAARGELQFVDARGKDHYQKNSEMITPTVVTKWIEKQNRTDDKLDISQWLRERVHYFPLPQEVPGELQASLSAIQEPQMHPIAKAAKIWFDIVRIHISHEANKRTGKAIASAILMSYGYLPPKIGKEDEKEYMAALQEGFEDENGLQKFTKFVAKIITKTHEEFVAK